MARININKRVDLNKVFKVSVLEYERGWGSKVDEVIYFDNEPEAKEYVNKFNSRNTEIRVPDWYMVANYNGKVG